MGGAQSVPESNSVESDPAEPARIVRAMLSRLGLPAELVLDIMDIAEYHPVVRDERCHEIRLRADSHAPRQYCSASLYLVSSPIPGGPEGENWRMRKVTWTIEGRDQGWGGDHPGTFNGAYAWYEACIFRPICHPTDTHDRAVFLSKELDAFRDEHDLYRNPQDILSRLAEKQVDWTLVPNGDGYVWRVQSNRVARAEFQKHTIKWRAGEILDAEEMRERGCGDGRGFVDALQPGDRVGLWVRAQYPGWMNTIKEAAIEIMYEVR